MNSTSSSKCLTELLSARVALPMTHPPHAKSHLGSVAYSTGTLEQFHETICHWLRDHHHRSSNASIGYVNPHVYTLAMKHKAVRAFLDEADIVAVDGVGFSLALWLLKGERQSRTVMTPLFDKVVETDDLPLIRAVVIGGTDEVARKGTEAINRVSRKIQVVASANGYKPLGEYCNFLREQENIDLVLVAMGSPRSEEFILENRSLFPEKIFWNIGGGTLKFYSGDLRPVPKIVSKLCLQWLWRMACEPYLVPRYAVGIPVFAAQVLQARRNEKKKGSCLC